MSKIIYRREIDGLRALAVVPVMLFHAGLETFSGGFVGVDVFFVISGYLITTIILTDLEQGNFSIGDFYERRARRILPTLFLVMFACIPFAWFWLVPRDMKDFSDSLFAAPIFLSNHLFFSKSGYFDTGAEFKPLLHTWSLAVEEQYYVIFPALLMLAWQLPKRWAAVLFGAAFVSSLALAQWASQFKPAAAFYFLPTRVWELLLGAFGAFYLSHSQRKGPDKKIGELLGWLGLFLIFYSVFSYNKATPFPSFFSLAPTVGTLLIILFASQHNFVGKFIGNKLFVGIGLISYSLYLWHHPIYSLARHSSFESPSRTLLAWLSLFVFVVSYFSWRFVEIPIRNKDFIVRKHFIWSASLAGVFFLLIGFWGHVQAGFPTTATSLQIPKKTLSEKNFILIGDSHADHLAFGLKSTTSGNVLNLAKAGCIPLRNVDRYNYQTAPGECAKKTNSSLDKVINDDPKAVIVLSSMGPVYLEGVPYNGKGYDRVTGLVVELISDKTITDRYQVFEIGLRQTLAELSNLTNAEVVFALDVPELGIEFGCFRGRKELVVGSFVLRDFVVNRLTEKSCFVDRRDYEQRVLSYKSFVLRIASDYPKVRVFDPSNSFCDDKTCKGFDEKYGFLYRDLDHLSEGGSYFYASRFIDFLSRK